MMETTTLIDCLRREISDALELASSLDQLTILVPREHLIQTCRLLRDHPALQFTLLAEITAVDWWPREPRFEVVYHLACLGPYGLPDLPRVPPARVRLKVRVGSGDPPVPTLSAVWPCADWLEREVWDLFGIVFDGHPDLRRLLMPDDWEGHPLRKDYPVQVKLPVRTQQPLQLTPDEFVSNITAARQGVRPPDRRDETEA